MKYLLATALILTSITVAPAHAGDSTKPRQCQIFFDFDCKEDHYCRSLGTLPGQPAYINCRLIVAEQRQRRGLAIARLGFGLAAQSQPHGCMGSGDYGTWHATCW
jgi:hypothetical protein